ncbi:hypothetical protein [Quatrionicoccus australiensis]|uniref:hypothetical protein n=1 Tax=Quatrionicoccus australiensis TaxID=138118 RepID=UPI001CFC20CD|nr:hypothetical protein [Quatrionicoccus australiensis]MCB4360432.1 hypothetical protein [Quatrionicoccus australiensis]
MRQLKVTILHHVGNRHRRPLGLKPCLFDQTHAILGIPQIIRDDHQNEGVRTIKVQSGLLCVMTENRLQAGLTGQTAQQAAKTAGRIDTKDGIHEGLGIDAATGTALKNGKSGARAISMMKYFFLFFYRLTKS